MLNILVLDYDFSDSYYKNSFYLWDELKKISNCVLLTTTQYHPAEDIEEIIQMSPFTPDFIIINEFVNFHHNWGITGMEKVKIPIGYLPHDIDAAIALRREFMSQDNINLIFPLYKESFLRNYAEFTDKMRWLPHHVNTEVFKDYHMKKDIDGLLIGRVKQEYYSLRKKILKKMDGHPGFVYVLHPSDHDPPKSIALEGEEFAKFINQSKVFFSCCSTLRYPLLKYFETLGCRTLLLADTCSDLTELGFIPNEHFVEINEDNFYEKFLYYINNWEERERIATDGYQFIREHHSTSARAQQLLSYIHEFLEQTEDKKIDNQAPPSPQTQKEQ